MRKGAQRLATSCYLNFGHSYNYMIIWEFLYLNVLCIHALFTVLEDKHFAARKVKGKTNSCIVNITATALVINLHRDFTFLPYKV